MNPAPLTRWYSVYNQKGDHQASYDQSLPDAYGWALDCARHVGGYVCECSPNQPEEIIFNTKRAS